MTTEDLKRFDSLYTMYAPLIRRIVAYRGVREADIDDVVQETFVTVHRLLPSFEGRAALATWLHAVAWRVAANYRRSQQHTVVQQRLVV
ncbi:MAG: RNA polymerase sigma factor, partial [Polyangiales bacterium]